jgi:uncharacterized membrane protein YjfL (UPF0719 family)
MTQAECVLSTPPTNTSALPADPSRRGFLAQAAAVAAGGVTLGLALPLPGSAGAAERVADPIYDAIDKHRQAVVAHDAVTDVRAAFDDINMNDEQETQLEFLEAAVDDAWSRLEDAGINLVNTDPTTLAGIMTLCRYVEPLLNERDTVNLPEVIDWDDDTHSSAAGALVNVIALAVKALIAQKLPS